ncbi:MAG: SDR family oxidoreductase [Bauldia sp.]|nr:MAG: SDR family oxidoreductase [Bauldia sp.]
MSETTAVALVTGGARRIGRAIVEDLAAHGWAVAIHYNYSQNDAEALAAAIRDSGGRAAAVGADLGDPDSVAGLVNAAEAILGKPRLLVNNASMFETDSGGALDPALFDRLMAVNLRAPVFLTEAFAAALPDGVEGNVVNLIDQSVWKPAPKNFSYQLAKSALWTATQMHAQALAPKVRVNAIAPGPTFRHTRQTGEQFAARVATLLLKRGPEPAEFGRTIRYLVENRSITGQMIGLDGGQHLAWETPDVSGPDD